ncbi:NAD(P)/FAD-dependent oxidoreductase [Fulvivirga sp. 2943]|uniref:NAD(P)/FAD-dependent oxidoreductase n=2 Tax=Fulvivirga sediminis TaxID=2803949 RepID=A0A937K238_9BACT|nr:NAD(P)/FAD-dependent oxidoreductase [Fulvivirga sediminis]MBL3657372.1 NAD(P)/FAD-dependent oxidoreductase [Fulvivirga sediminis]
MKIAVIGGGAAGFFAAISCKQHHAEADVTIYEKTTKLLSKVKVSGGGRCNVTHACNNHVALSKYYPRGEKFLKKAFSQFAVDDTINWFESRGVSLKTEADNRMFPVTDDSQTIVDCLLSEARRLGVKINLKCGVNDVERTGASFQLHTESATQEVDKVIVTIGGATKPSMLSWIEKLGHSIETPVPSLFTFNMPADPIRELMGLAVERATVKVQATKLKSEGPLLITHWGMSGPAVLKLSAFGARLLADLNYDFKIQVNWVNETDVNVREMLAGFQQAHTKKKMLNGHPFVLPARLWEFLINKIGLRIDILWGELGNKGINKLVNVLINDIFEVKGKTTFKEEFVTCGGVSLTDIDVKTMQSRVVEGLYFAGEVMGIDGVTGGFNFQAAWTTGFIAGKLG